MNGYACMLLAALSFRRDMILAVFDCEKSALYALDESWLDKHSLETKTLEQTLCQNTLVSPTIR
jgi:hypothetical protein